MAEENTKPKPKAEKKQELSTVVSFDEIKEPHYIVLRRSGKKDVQDVMLGDMSKDAPYKVPTVEQVLRLEGLPVPEKPGDEVLVEFAASGKIIKAVRVENK